MPACSNAWSARKISSCVFTAPSVVAGGGKSVVASSGTYAVDVCWLICGWPWIAGRNWMAGGLPWMFCKLWCLDCSVSGNERNHRALPTPWNVCASAAERNCKLLWLLFMLKLEWFVYTKKQVYKQKTIDQNKSIDLGHTHCYNKVREISNCWDEWQRNDETCIFVLSWRFVTCYEKSSSIVCVLIDLVYQQFVKYMVHQSASWLRWLARDRLMIKWCR